MNVSGLRALGAEYVSPTHAFVQQIVSTTYTYPATTFREWGFYPQVFS